MRGVYDRNCRIDILAYPKDVYEKKVVEDIVKQLSKTLTELNKRLMMVEEKVERLENRIILFK